MNDSKGCNICFSKVEFSFESIILNKYKIKYFQCTKCGFTQTESPYWLNESYVKSMNLGDTGQVNRNLINSIKVKFIINEMFDTNGRFLDFAGGYGLFTRLMRDFGFHFIWEDKYTENIFALGSEASTVDKDRFEAITVFECFEHWSDPLTEIKNLFLRTDSIIFTTNLISIPAPKPERWWYYGFDHGQHISFFSKKSLLHISKVFGCDFVSKYGVHILSRNKISRIKLFIAVLKAKLFISFSNLGNKKSLINSDHLRLTNQ
jgi:hypothetical protein